MLGRLLLRSFAAGVAARPGARPTVVARRPVDLPRLTAPRSRCSTGWRRPPRRAVPAGAPARSDRAGVPVGPHAARRPGLRRPSRGHGRSVEGARVLLLDDTYVSGARAQSAGGCAAPGRCRLGGRRRPRARPAARSLGRARRVLRPGADTGASPGDREPATAAGCAQAGTADRVAHAGQLVPTPTRAPRPPSGVAGAPRRPRPRGAARRARTVRPARRTAPPRRRRGRGVERWARLRPPCGCPNVVPAARASVRRTRPPLQIGAVPGQVAPGPARVRRHGERSAGPRATSRSLSSAAKRRLASLEVP